MQRHRRLMQRRMRRRKPHPNHPIRLPPRPNPRQRIIHMLTRRIRIHQRNRHPIHHLRPIKKIRHRPPQHPRKMIPAPQLIRTQTTAPQMPLSKTRHRIAQRLIIKRLRKRILLPRKLIRRIRAQHPRTKPITPRQHRRPRRRTRRIRIPLIKNHAPRRQRRHIRHRRKTSPRIRTRKRQTIQPHIIRNQD